MEIKQKHFPSHGIFFIEEEGQLLGEMTYAMDKKTLVIEHTQVANVLRGKGAGKQLVAAGVAYARENNYTILPLCSFAKSLIDHVKEFQDVLKD